MSSSKSDRKAPSTTSTHKKRQRHNIPETHEKDPGTGRRAASARAVSNREPRKATGRGTGRTQAREDATAAGARRQGGQKDRRGKTKPGREETEKREADGRRAQEHKQQTRK